MALLLLLRLTLVPRCHRYRPRPQSRPRPLRHCPLPLLALVHSHVPSVRRCAIRARFSNYMSLECTSSHCPRTPSIAPFTHSMACPLVPCVCTPSRDGKCLRNTLNPGVALLCLCRPLSRHSRPLRRSLTPPDRPLLPLRLPPLRHIHLHAPHFL